MEQIKCFKLRKFHYLQFARKTLSFWNAPILSRFVRFENCAEIAYFCMKICSFGTYINMISLKAIQSDVICLCTQGI